MNTLEYRLRSCASLEAISFIKQCLQIDPRERPSSSELLNHELFAEFRRQFDEELKFLVREDTKDVLAESASQVNFTRNSTDSFDL
jgi:serine/threonine protein kinase